MTLEETAVTLADLDDDDTFFVAQPWTEKSMTIVVRGTSSGGLPFEAIELGLKYFLEVSIARDLLQHWAALFDPEPTNHEKVDRLIYYALYDA